MGGGGRHFTTAASFVEKVANCASTTTVPLPKLKLSLNLLPVFDMLYNVPFVAEWI